MEKKDSFKKPKNKNIITINNSSDIENDEDSIDSKYFENPNNELIKLSDEEEMNDYQENSKLLLENIRAILEKLSTNFKNDQKFLFNILKEINTVINLIINEFINDSKKKNISNSNENDTQNFFITEEKNNSNDDEIKNNNLNINSKVVFLLKIETLNRKIKALNEEINNLKSLLFDSNNKVNQNQNNNYYKIVMKKFKEIKDRKKCDEFKYLMYIENQKKKIMDLEAKLNIKTNENLSKDTLKSIRCFPNFVQYNFKEDINPKTIPLSQFFQLEKEKDKKRKEPLKKNISKREIINCLSFENNNKKRMKYICNTTKKNKKKYRNKEIIIDDKIKTDENNNKNSYNNNKNNNNIITIKDIKKNIKLFGDKVEYNTFQSNKNLNIANYKLDCNKNYFINFHTLNHDEHNITEYRKKIYGIAKDLPKEIKDFNPKTIINNKKEFFIAHPTLNIAGIAKGKEQVYIGLPKKLIKLNKGGNFKSMMVFPSSLNETMVNLEKLRSNKLHIDINTKDNNNN